MATLDALPPTPPPGTIDEWDVYESCCFANEQLASAAWLWMLDRAYFQKYIAAKASGNGSMLEPHQHPEDRRFEPWLCTRILRLPKVWFGRPQHMTMPR